MKSFMEEYGKVIIVAIILVGLIGVAVVFKGTGTTSIKSMLNNYLVKSGSDIGGSAIEAGEEGGSKESGGSTTETTTVKAGTYDTKPTGQLGSGLGMYQNTAGKWVVAKTKVGRFGMLASSLEYVQGMTWREWLSSEYNDPDDPFTEYDITNDTYGVADSIDKVMKG